MNFNKLKWPILIFIFMILSIISSNNVHALGCCALNTGVCATYTPPGCNDPNVAITDQMSCEQLNLISPLNCTTGCCCSEPTYVKTLKAQCLKQFGPDTAFFYVDEGLDFDTFCSDECNGQLQTHPVHGIVYTEAGAPVEGATVTIDAGSEPYVTSSSGYYIFNNIPAGQRTLTAVKDGCTATQTFLLNEEKNIDLTLHCCGLECQEWGPCMNNIQTRSCTNTCTGVTSTEAQACYPELCTYQCTDWDPPDCEYGTQQTHTCTPVNLPPGCSGWPIPPPLTRPCPSSSSICGNFQVEPGEDCDYNPVTGQGENTCLPNYVCTNCLCIPPSGGCYDDHPATPLKPLEPDGHVPYERKINVEWDLPNGECADKIDNYILWGWENGSELLTKHVIDDNIPNTDDSYMVNDDDPMDLRDNQVYCFVLTTVYNDEVGDPHYMNSSPECINIGDKYCLDGHHTMCSSLDGLATAITCQANNSWIYRITRPEGDPETTCKTSEEFCRIVEDIGYCVLVSGCDACNWYFGAFGYQGFGFPYRDIVCPTLDISQSYNFSSDNEDEFTGCFLDRTNTGVDWAQSCGNVHSCYDYKSRGACVEDRCETLSVDGVSGCEWADYSLEFNKGVCRPKPELVNQNIIGFEQQCDLCDDPAYNWIYPVCTKSVCLLFGRCYYNDDQCKDGLNIKCSDYGSLTDCVGNSVYSVDISWNNDHTSATGTNTRFSLSNDTYGLGVCKWNNELTEGNNCFRDADNYPIVPGNTGGKDCKIVGNIAKNKCERDVTPPVSLINNHSMYGAIMDLKGSITLDDVPGWMFGDDMTTPANDRDTIWLYYCINQTTQTCYPYNILRVHSATEELEMTIDLSELQHMQEYTFSYFTEDPGRNREVIKRFNFTLDKNPPEIVWTNVMTARLTNDGNWVTDVKITIQSSSEDTYPVTCTFNLTPETNIDIWTGWIHDIVNGVITSDGGTLNTTYIGLASDIYTYKLSCSDGVGNVYYEENTLLVDGDSTINNATPQNTTPPFRSEDLPEKMSIHTINPGTCRYSMTTINYDDMQGSFARTMINDNDYIYEDSISNVLLSDPVYNASGVYRIYPACRLIINGEEKTVLGEDSDIITFAVDDLPPISQLYYSTGGDYQLYQPGTVQGFDHIMLDIVGNDSAPILNYFGDDRSFGVEHSYYCKKLKNQPDSCSLPSDFDVYDPTDPITYDYTDPDNSIDKQLYGNNPTLCYYSIDNGENIEPMKCTTITARNTLFLAPDITIIPTEN